MDANSISTIEVFISECVLIDALLQEQVIVDDEVLIDIDYNKNKRANAIIRQIELKYETKIEANKENKDRNNKKINKDIKKRK